MTTVYMIQILSKMYNRKRLTRRKCHFVATIFDADHYAMSTLPVAQTPNLEKTYLLLDTLGIFRGEKKQTKGNYGMLHTVYFV